MSIEEDLSQQFMEKHPLDAAKVLESLSTEVSAALLEQSSVEVSTKIIEHMVPLTAVKCLEHLDPAQIAQFIKPMKKDEAIRLCRHFESKKLTAVLSHVPKDKSALFKRFLNYAENTAGALMDPQVLAYRETTTVKRALEQFQVRAQSSLHYLYILNKQKKLVGVLNLSELMTTGAETKLSEIMRPCRDSLVDYANKLEILSHPGWKRFHALPVLDDFGVFLGVLRYEVIRQLEDETDKRGSLTNIEAGAALGELYGIGLSIFLGGRNK